MNFIYCIVLPIIKVFGKFFYILLRTGYVNTTLHNVSFHYRLGRLTRTRSGDDDLMLSSLISDISEKELELDPPKITASKDRPW